MLAPPSPPGGPEAPPATARDRLRLVAAVAYIVTPAGALVARRLQEAEPFY